MRTFTRYLLIFLLICMSLHTSLLYAQSCASCSSAPENVRTYFEMMDALITLMEQPPWDVANQWSILFDEWDEQWPTDIRAWLINITNRLSRDLEVAKLVTWNYLIPHLAWTTFNELKILAAWPTMQRDRALLLQIDERISDAFVTMYSWNYLTIWLPDAVLNQIDEILQTTEYMRLRENFGVYNMQQSWAQYRDFWFMLWQLNWIFKEIHANIWYQDELRDATSEYLIANLDDPDEATEHPVNVQLAWVYKSIQALIQKYMAQLTNERTWPSFERIEFDDEAFKFLAAIWHTQSEYACAVWVRNLCDEWWRATVEESWNYTKNIFMQDAQSAINTFKEAFSRLKGVLFVWSPEDKAAARQRQNELMHSRYAQGLPSHIEWWNQSEGGIDANVPASWQSGGWIRRLLTRATNNRFIQVSWTSWDSATARFISGWVELVKNLLKRDKNNAENFQSQSEKNDKLEEIRDYIKEVTDTVWWSETMDLRSFINQTDVQRETLSFQNTYRSMKSFQVSLTQQAIMMDPYEFTKQFPALSNAVHQNIRLIGTQSWEWDTKWVYYYMGEVCSQQCAENLQWRCRYDV